MNDQPEFDKNGIEKPEGYLFGKIPYYKKEPLTFGRGIGIAIMMAVIALYGSGYLTGQ